MPRSPTDILQSFRLRFWREPREGTSGEWRGSVWHEQQAPDEAAIAVINPEEAFALVRRTLELSGEPCADGPVPAGGDGTNSHTQPTTK